MLELIDVRTPYASNAVVVKYPGHLLALSKGSLKAAVHALSVTRYICANYHKS